MLLGNGNGTFQPYYDIPAGSDPYDVKVADLTGDGKPTSSSPTRTTTQSACSWATATARSSRWSAYPVASGPYEVVVADLTGNGIPDLVVSHFSATVVDVLLGNGNGTFQPRVNSRSARGPTGWRWRT